MIRAPAAVAVVVVGPAIVAPMLAVTPPLQSDPERSGDRPRYAVEFNMSPTALAGRHLFVEVCGDCHGGEGQGAGAPPVSGPQIGGRSFHMAALDPENPDHSFGTGVGFNELERMAKYLREVSRKE